MKTVVEALPSAFEPDISVVPPIAPASFAAVIFVSAAEQPLNTIVATSNVAIVLETMAFNMIYPLLGVADFRTPFKGCIN